MVTWIYCETLENNDLSPLWESPSLFVSLLTIILNTLKVSLTRNHSPWKTPLLSTVLKSYFNEDIRVGFNDWYPVPEERHINKETPAKQDKLSHESGPVFLKMWQNYFRIDKNGNSPISVFHRLFLFGIWSPRSDWYTQWQSLRLFFEMGN